MKILLLALSILIQHFFVKEPSKTVVVEHTVSDQLEVSGGNSEIKLKI